jgi:hypothetical protein
MTVSQYPKRAMSPAALRVLLTAKHRHVSFDFLGSLALTHPILLTTHLSLAILQSCDQGLRGDPQLSPNYS